LRLVGEGGQLLVEVSRRRRPRPRPRREAPRATAARRDGGAVAPRGQASEHGCLSRWGERRSHRGIRAPRAGRTGRADVYEAAQAWPRPLPGTVFRPRASPSAMETLVLVPRPPDPPEPPPRRRSRQLP